MLVLGLGLALCSRGWAQPSLYQPGHSYYGRSNYVHYLAGDMPVIFSVPHGGSLTPEEIPNRNCAGYSGDCATISDANTEELALTIQKTFRSYYGHCPHVVICRLKRTKLDCNRDIGEAAVGNPQAEQAWREYHGYINAASSAIRATTGCGLYIDLHGQSHPIKRVELGYLLNAQQLTNSDAVLNHSNYAAQSSIRALAARVAVPFAELLRGSNSFGGLLLAKGYPSVPDPLMPSPWQGSAPKTGSGEEVEYFGGGYSTRLHSSAGQGGSVDGLQMEANLEGVRDTATNRANFALALAQVMDRFFAVHYRLDLKTGAVCSEARPSGAPGRNTAASTPPAALRPRPL
jgi:N-formylglutamate amidohydrolase